MRGAGEGRSVMLRGCERYEHFLPRSSPLFRPSRIVAAKV